MSVYTPIVFQAGQFAKLSIDYPSEQSAPAAQTDLSLARSFSGKTFYRQKQKKMKQKKPCKTVNKKVRFSNFISHPKTGGFQSRFF